MPRWQVLTVGLLSTLALGVMDYVSGYELGFFVFYYLPIAFSAWHGRRTMGVAIALLSGLVWYGSDWLSGHPYSTHVFGAWNSGIRLVAFVVVAVTISQCRELLERQKQSALALRKALADVKQLKGLLPICAWCKHVRNDKGYWEQIEKYVASRTDADFSHGICPNCARKMAEVKPVGETAAKMVDTGQQDQRPGTPHFEQPDADP